MHGRYDGFLDFSASIKVSFQDLYHHVFRRQRIQKHFLCCALIAVLRRSA
jgi:hypothetical protein